MLPLAFLPLVGLEILALALPSFALNLLADFAPMHQVYTLIYAAPIVPFAVMASIYGAHRLVAWSARIVSAESKTAESTAIGLPYGRSERRMLRPSPSSWPR